MFIFFLFLTLDFIENVFMFIIPSDKAFAKHLYFVMIVPRIKYLIKRNLFDYTQNIYNSMINAKF
jgi:hypothetical protein